MVATALIAGLAAWGLLALLERGVRYAARTYRIIALVLLVVSLAGPLGSGVGTSSRLVLLGMHLIVGAALIIVLPGSSRPEKQGVPGRYRPERRRSRPKKQGGRVQESKAVGPRKAGRARPIG